MSQPKSNSHYAFDRPGNYRIRVEGFLDKNWSDKLAGMNISPVSGRGQRSVTVVEGFLRDQAELIGVVTALYNLHLTLLLVDYMDE
jgi:hypothetical protein